MLMVLTEETSVADIEIALRSGGLEIEPLAKFQDEECAGSFVSALVHARNGTIITLYALYPDGMQRTYEQLAIDIHGAVQGNIC